MIRLSSIVGVAVASAICGQAAATAILVYDNNTQHGLAWTAAQNIGTATKTDATTFYSQLALGGWDVVAVDCPSTIPAGGWAQLAAYVNGGGAVVMAYWNWDSEPGITQAMGATSTAGDVSWVDGSTTLTDMGVPGIFAGVTMPNSSWHNHWADDGDRFNLAGGSVGLAQIGGAGAPVMFAGNGGKTIASSVLDDAGDLWLGDGSAVQLWENMMTYVPGPGAFALLSLAGLVGARRRR